MLEVAPELAGDAPEHLELDVVGYDAGLALIEVGRAMEILDPPAAGAIRQGMSDSVNEFEGARHRFRLALVAVAADNGLSARQIGDAFSFSRQLASRYLNEAYQKWPELEAHEEDAGHAGDQRDARDLVDLGPVDA